jgi:gamma-glutamyltranspeptidase / glutathione hydrolase
LKIKQAMGWIFGGVLSLHAHGAAQWPVIAKHGMVVSAHHLASQAGVEVLKQGGNAVDAAIATAYALAVVYPAAGNLGGGGFMTIRTSKGENFFLDFREKAPLKATSNLYLDSLGQVIKDKSIKGHLAVGVPGTVSGLEMARIQWATMKRARLLAPAITLAQKGFVLDGGDVEMLQLATEDFKNNASMGDIFLNRGKPFNEGERLIQTDLSRTLQRIKLKGVEGFYKGVTAQELLKSSQEGGGIITQEDLDQYQTRILTPIECDYRGYHLISAPPPSSGGVILCEMLKVLEPYPLKTLGFNSAKTVQLMVEAMRHAYKDRNTRLGDPAFVDNPIEELLSPQHLQEIRREIVDSKATPSIKSEHNEWWKEGDNTTHFSVVDQWGNAVSMTYTLNSWFGAKVMAGKTGVILNNEMDDFTLKPGEPNQFKLIQGLLNQIEPGKRPLSSMTPTIVTKNDELVMSLGTPGGSKIITAVLQTLVNVIDFGMNIQEAVDAPRFHHQWLPDQIYAEPRSLSIDTMSLLNTWGYRIVTAPQANHMAAIYVNLDKNSEESPYTFRLNGANDSRKRTGLALGY